MFKFFLKHINLYMIVILKKTILLIKRKLVQDNAAGIRN